jgi:hypothetical protein
VPIWLLDLLLNSYLSAPFVCILVIFPLDKIRNLNFFKSKVWMIHTRIKNRFLSIKGPFLAASDYLFKKIKLMGIEPTSKKNKVSFLLLGLYIQ